jgi:hypothetical protein
MSDGLLLGTTSPTVATLRTRRSVYVWSNAAPLSCDLGMPIEVPPGYESNWVFTDQSCSAMTSAVGLLRHVAPPRELDR